MLTRERIVEREVETVSRMLFWPGGKLRAHWKMVDLDRYRSILKPCRCLKLGARLRRTRKRDHYYPGIWIKR